MLTSSPKKQIPYLATVIAFVAIVIMLGLGFWQLERKSEKEIRLTNIEQAKQSASVSFEDAFSNIYDFQDYVVYGEGKIINTTFYIDNKIVNGRAGFHILVPYETKLGILLVNLGWVPAKGVRATLPEFTMPNLGDVEGIVYLPVKNKLITETNKKYGEFPVLLQQVDLEEISLHLGQKVLPATLRLLPDESSFVRQWQAVTMTPDKHLGYAIQWFGLAIAALTVFLLSLLKTLKGPPPTGGKSE